MAKSRAQSKHSRAARRATSPGIDTDKSLKDVKPPSSGTQRPSVLAVHQSAGVQKKTKKKGNMTAKMRKRHERGLQMAEAVAERTFKKVERSKGREKTVLSRRKEWEKINKDAVTFSVLADAPESEGEDDAGEDKEEMVEDAGAEAKGASAATAEQASVVEEPGADGFIPVDDEEEIL